MKNRLFITLILFAILTLSSQCKKKCSDPTNPDCDNYNPCYGKKAVSAAFTIFEEVNVVPTFEVPYYDTDTITMNQARFTALEEGAEYEWHIGSEILRTKSFTRSDFPQNQSIPVTLIVKKTPDTSCFPNDDGADTLTRYLWKCRFFDNSKLFGTFKGFFDNNKQDTATVKIFKGERWRGSTLDPQLLISNLISGCTDTLASSDIPFRGFKKVYDYFPDYCKRPHGLFAIRGKNNDTLDINIQQERVRDASDKITRRFVGVRQ
jgi:hypothetical protein